MLSTGIWQLEELAQRWPDVEAAKEARKILSDYRSRESRPWEEEERNHQLRLARFLATGYEAAAQSRTPGMTKVHRSSLAHSAVLNWRKVIDQSEDSVLVESAKERLPGLERMVANVPVRDAAVLPPKVADGKRSSSDREPILPHLVFNIRRTFLLAELIDLLKRQPGGDVIDVRVDETAIRKARLTTRRRVSVNLTAASADDVLTTVLAALGLSYQFEGGVITIYPVLETEDLGVVPPE